VNSGQTVTSDASLTAPRNNGFIVYPHAGEKHEANCNLSIFHPHYAGVASTGVAQSAPPNEDRSYGLKTLGWAATLGMVACVVGMVVTAFV
jgi:hypothetical protein